MYLSTSVLVLLLVLNLTKVGSENVGWKSYLKENPQEFHDLPLTWEKGSKVPSWLAGTYVRNGPAQISFGSDRRVLSSWLDGYGKLHSFKFNGEQVVFSGRMLESPNYLASVAAGELAPQTTLNAFTNVEDEWSFWEKLKIAYKVLMGTAFDNNNPVVWRLGPKSPDSGIYLAMTDNPNPIRFNISDLSTLGMHKPSSYPMTLSGCAHYLREKGTDNSISFQSKKLFTGKPYIEVQRYKPSSTFQDPEVIATFTPKKFSNIHSFSLTDQYAIFFFYPVVIDPKKYWSSNFHVFELLEWLEGEQTDVFVVNIKTGHVTTLATEPFYSAHHVNAYQDTKDELVVDICPTPFSNMRDYLKLENMMNPPEKSEWVSTNKDLEFTRFKINMATEKITQSLFPNHLKSKWINQFDFPVINERYRGEKYCVVYGWTAFDYSRMALVKKNVCDSSLDKVWYVENHYSSEMWFLEAPDAKKEDDGVLLTIVFDGEREQSYLLLLDARTLSPVARSYLPMNLPWSAHGMHFPEATMAALNHEAPKTNKDEL